MAHDLVCWKCGASLASLSLPLLRRDACPACHADLHVCRLCVEYDISKAKHCREPTAEEERNKERANFCDHFRPRPAAWSAQGASDAERAAAELAKLFGG